MGRLLVLVALMGVMLTLRTLRLETDGAFDALILAAIGFVILASYTAAEVGTVLTLPRVSGYIAAGVLLGPSVFDVLSSRVVEEMTMFNTLALGLIATGAGLELEFRSLGRLWKALFATVLGKVILSGGLVFGLFVLVQRTLEPLALTTQPQVFAVGLVLATLSVGTSPAIVLAVINEMNARGRVADLALGAAVIKDFVLVVLLAIALAMSNLWLGSASAEGSIVSHVGQELLGSLAVGALVGAIIVVYVRFVAAEMLLFVAALILAVAEISRALHLDLLMVFIASGFVVRNFSKVWEDVLHALETVALPVFVVFFTIAGARIDLEVTYRMLPFALLLCAARAAGFYGATRFGAWVVGDNRDVAHRSFLAYLPQAGVTLGLLGTATQALPTIATELQSIGIAMVAINLAVGPVTLRKGLQTATRRKQSDQQESVRPSLPVPDFTSKGPPATAQSLDFGGPELLDEVSHLERDLLAILERVTRHHLVAHGQALSLELSSVMLEDDPHATVQRLHRWARESRAKELVQRASQAARNLLDECEARLALLHAEVSMPRAAHLLQSSTHDGRVLRVKKFLARVSMRLNKRSRVRHVPLRLAARYALSPRLAQLAPHLLGSFCRAHGRVLAELRRAANGELSMLELADAVTAHLEALPRDFRSDARVAVGNGLLELAELTVDIDSPMRPLGSLRFSSVEREARHHAEALTIAPVEWERVLSAAEGSLVLATAVSRAGHGAEEALEREVLMPLAEAADALEPAVKAARNQLLQALQAARDSGCSDDDLIIHRDAFTRLREQREREGGLAAGSFRAAEALHAANVEVRQLVDSLSEQLFVPAHVDEPGFAADPTQVSTHVIFLRNEARRVLILELMPTVDLEGGRAAGSVQDLEARRAESIEMSESALDAVLAGELGRKELEETLERAIAHLGQGETAARTQLVAAHDTIAAHLAAALAHLSDLTDRGVREALAFAKTPIAPLRRLSERTAEARQWVMRQWKRVQSQWSDLQGAELAQHLTSELHSTRDLAAFFQADGASLPVVYSRLFRLEPLRDLRLSAARDNELSQLLEAEHAWLKGGPSSALIVGAAGSGRTSLLNLAQANFNAPRLIRPTAIATPRATGLTRALAYELRRRPTRKEVAAGLCTQRTVVVLDDLGHWFEPDAGGIADLRTFLDLVARTHREVFWVVTVTTHWLELVQDAVSVSELFGFVLRLPPLDARGLRKVIEARHMLSGMELNHRNTILSRVLGRAREDSAADLAFRLLHMVTGGNLQAAMAAWCRAVTIDDSIVTVHPHRLLMERLPAFTALEAPLLAILVQLARFGPQDTRCLAKALAMSRGEVVRHLLLLDNCGLLHRGEKQSYALEPEHQYRVLQRLPLSAERRS